MIEQYLRINFTLYIFAKDLNNQTLLILYLIIMNVVEQIEAIVSNKNNYLNLKQYEQIAQLINSNKADLFFVEPEAMAIIDPILNAYLDDAEMYYGFTKNEVLRFIEGLEFIGYTCNYVDVATRDNGELSHTVKPYNLRKII